MARESDQPTVRGSKRQWLRTQFLAGSRPADRPVEAGRISGRAAGPVGQKLCPGRRSRGTNLASGRGWDKIPSHRRLKEKDLKGVPVGKPETIRRTKSSAGSSLRADMGDRGRDSGRSAYRTFTLVFRTGRGSSVASFSRSHRNGGEWDSPQDRVAYRNPANPLIRMETEAPKAAAARPRRSQPR